MANKTIGKVTHYFDHIGVAVLALTKPIKIGDSLKFSGHGQEFTQVVSSMQLDHNPIKTAKPGEDIALKVDQAVKQGDKVAII